MIYKDVLIAGFGGQGVMLAGRLLAWAAMLDGLHVTWFPSYGAEMRGGTANCTVIISGEEIGSPVIDRPEALIALNQASAGRFSEKITKGGLILINTSLVKDKISRPGVKVVGLPANEIAEELGNPRAVNMVMLGAYIRLTGAVGLASVEKALGETVSARTRSLIPVNMTAIETGYNYVPLTPAPPPPVGGGKKGGG